MLGNYIKDVMNTWPVGASKIYGRLLALSFCVAFSSSYAQEESEYLRFIPGTAEWEGELQTAIVSFENDAGIQLNLVSAVHLGEEEYYRELNDYFATQDVVLYELIAEPDQVPVRGSGGNSFIGLIQQAMAGFLDIGFQLEEIDYSRPNFLHADLTPAQLGALMASKDENFFTMFLNLAMAQMAEQNATAEQPVSSFTLLSLINALNSEDQNGALKFLFAEELGRSGGLIVGEALEQQLTILGDRNKAALRVLAQVLENPEFRQISIYYGAAHMPGIEREITASMGFRRSNIAWQTAWIAP
ncbi:MAG: hypothetical protein DHS20C12_18470 [Pseudohongiella sp.]|nr:MAG: hypothetical protein DHS20C12_18470 [Pseudohongiella sp.]